MPTRSWTPRTFSSPARPRLELLRVAALYGANASGKSNVLQALQSFLLTVIESANEGFSFLATPFRLDTISASRPILFELTFVRMGLQYRYGFEWSEDGIVSEWLFRATSSVEAVLFERRGDEVKRGSSFREGTGLLKNGRTPRHDALFLSLVSLAGGDLARDLVQYMKGSIRTISGLTDKHLRDL